MNGFLLIWVKGEIATLEDFILIFKIFSSFHIIKCEFQVNNIVEKFKLSSVSEFS